LFIQQQGKTPIVTLRVKLFLVLLLQSLYLVRERVRRLQT